MGTMVVFLNCSTHKFYTTFYINLRPVCIFSKYLSIAIFIISAVAMENSECPFHAILTSFDKELGLSEYLDFLPCWFVALSIVSAVASRVPSQNVI